MSNEEIYKQAVTIAVHNGFNFGMSSTYTKQEIIDFLVTDYEKPDEFSVIFNHNFARAFFGRAIGHRFLEDDLCKRCGLDSAFWTGDMCKESFLSNLQDMVIEKDPIQYLEQFLPNPKGETV